MDVDRGLRPFAFGVLLGVGGDATCVSRGVSASDRWTGQSLSQRRHGDIGLLGTSLAASVPVPVDLRPIIDLSINKTLSCLDYILLLALPA